MDGHGSGLSIMVIEAANSLHELEQLDLDLLAQQWPGTARAAVQNLIEKNASLVSDLGSLNSLDPHDLSQWNVQMRKDAQRSAQAALVVHNDLGIPQIYA